MLGLPKSTEVNYRITKEKLYAKAALTPQERNIVKDHIESIIWRNKLADNTVGISVGETISEIQVFEINLRQRELDKRVLATIAKAIPYKILFILTYSGEAQAWVEAADTFYNTDWQPIDDLKLNLDGLNLDTVYENLARRIADGRLGNDGDIEEVVNRDKRRQKLEREIAALEKKRDREIQFNKQVEMNAEIKRMKKLKKELEG